MATQSGNGSVTNGSTLPASRRRRGSYAYAMVLRRRGPGADRVKSRAAWGALARRRIIPIIGAVTPVGLIVVNIAAFIVKHLVEFRWTIAILAFVSALMLNSWAGLNIYRVLQRRRPDHALVHERNQEVVLVGGMAVIIIVAFLTALFCYLGLSNPNDLPNGLTFITGVLAILVPILLQAAFRGAYRRQPPTRLDAGISSYAPPPLTPPTPPTPDIVRRT